MLSYLLSSPRGSTYVQNVYMRVVKMQNLLTQDDPNNDVGWVLVLLSRLNMGCISGSGLGIGFASHSFIMAGPTEQKSAVAYLV